MMVGPTYDDLFALLVKSYSERLRQKATRLGQERAREGTLSGLSAAQLNGVATLVRTEDDLDEIRHELQKRSEKRWTKKGDQRNPLPVLEADMNELSDDAESLLQESELQLNVALDAAGSGETPGHRDWHGELNAMLVRVYFTALVTATRMRKTARVPNGGPPDA